MIEKERRVLVLALLIITGFSVVVLGQESWASPVQNPRNQTIPPRPTVAVTDTPESGSEENGDDEAEDSGPSWQGPPPVPRRIDVVETTAPESSPYPLSSPTAVTVPTSESVAPGFPNCRLGVAVVNNPIGAYDTRGLNLGWYVNYRTTEPSDAPGGMEFVHMVRVHQAKHDWCRDCYTEPYTYTVTPDTETLRQQVRANPHGTWLIGNEPDCRDWETGRQDEMIPELYAQAFREISQLIRQQDPTAKVAIAGVMQATPLRLEYLDRVWEQYQALYGHRLGDDVDVWNTHAYILREEKDNWGAEIPPGFSESRGILYEIDDNANFDHFKEQISRFRTWMRDKGERDKPLYVTEYGVIMPPHYIPTGKVMAFMGDSLDYMLNVTDLELGYPADDNRLVQRCLWYSLDDSADNTDRAEDYGGALFSSVTLERLELGDYLAAYISDPRRTEANVPRVNLVVADFEATVSGGLSSSSPVTLTLRATIQNRGNTTARSGDGIEVRFWDGRPGNPQSQLLGTHVVRDVYGCAYAAVVEQRLRTEPAGIQDHTWFVDVEAVPGEEDLRDNIASTPVTDSVDGE